MQPPSPPAPPPPGPTPPSAVSSICMRSTLSGCFHACRLFRCSAALWGMLQDNTHVFHMFASAHPVLYHQVNFIGFKISVLALRCTQILIDRCGKRNTLLSLVGMSTKQWRAYCKGWGILPLLTQQSPSSALRSPMISQRNLAPAASSIWREA